MSSIHLPQDVIKKVTQEPQFLQVNWEDDSSSTFHYIWLRDNSPQSRDVHGQRCHEVSDVQTDVHPLSVNIIEHAGLEVLWDGANSRSYYSAAWLRNHCYSRHSQSLPAFNASRIRTNRPELWTGRVINKQMLTMSLDEIEVNPIRKRHWLELLSDFGVSVLRDVGTEPGDIERVATLLGQVRETPCDRIFDVKSAYSGERLVNSNRMPGVSTSMPYRDPVPAFQFLHCLLSHGSERDCIFVDGYLVSGLLRRKYPGMFLLLSAFPVPYIWLDSQHDLFVERPVINTNFRGEVIRVHFNHRASGPFHVPTCLMESYYDAYRMFDCLLNEPKHQLRFALEPGEVVVMDNHRILQGRLGVSDQQDRQLQVCYVESVGHSDTMALSQ